MKDLKDNPVLKKAVVRYGKDSQTLMAIEEMAELIKALCDHRRGRESNVSEEMADVYIMLAQLQIIHDNGLEVRNWVDAKINRLRGIIEGVDRRI